MAISEQNESFILKNERGDSRECKRRIEVVEKDEETLSAFSKIDTWSFENRYADFRKSIFAKRLVTEILLDIVHTVWKLLARSWIKVWDLRHGDVDRIIISGSSNFGWALFCQTSLGLRENLVLILSLSYKRTVMYNYYQNLASKTSKNIIASKTCRVDFALSLEPISCCSSFSSSLRPTN
jgi:hypothetical protein